MKVIHYKQCSDRIIWVRIECEPGDTINLQVDVPTLTYEDDKVARVYEEIEEVLKGLQGEDNLIFMDDWNAVVEGKRGKYCKKIWSR